MKWLTPTQRGGICCPTGCTAVNAAMKRGASHGPYWHRPAQEGKPSLKALRLVKARLEPSQLLAGGACPFRLTHPSVRGTGCGRSSSALGLGSEGHPAWTYVFREEFQAQRGGRPRRTALTGRPATSAWRVHPIGRKALTPPGGYSDDGGRPPRASRRSGLDRRAPLLWAPVRPSPERGGSGNRGSR
jgi:hypothetical protein